MSVDKYAPLFGEPVSGWFRWFAWRPIETVDRGWRWLRFVYRRRIHKHQYLHGGADFWFQQAVSIKGDSDTAAPNDIRGGIA